MKVTLARNWFGPDGTLRKAHIVHEVPNEWEKQLPPGAKVSEEVVAVKAPTKAETDKAAAKSDQKSLGL